MSLTRYFNRISICVRLFSVRGLSTIHTNKKEPDIDGDLIAHLERMSLVDFNNVEGIELLRKHIASANQLLDINIEGVKPLTTVLENRHLYLDKDEVCQENTRDDILRNAAKIEEEYFVAPPGNIPLKQDKERYG